MIDRLIAPLLPVSGQAPRLPEDGPGWARLLLAIASTWPTSMAVVSGLFALFQLVPGSQIAGSFEFYMIGAIAGQIAFGLFLILVAAVYPGARGGLIALFEVLWLAILPLWGLGIDLSLPACDACTDQNRAVAFPGLIAIYAVHLSAVIAYAVSRRTPTRAGNAAEMALSMALTAGVITGLALTIQFAPQLPLGAIFGFVGLPLVAPPVVAALFASQLAIRAWRGGSGPVGAGIAAMFGIAAVDAGVHVAITGAPELYAGALSQTCGWTLSALTPPPQDCHYLCTVAARGHPWLVRPQRLGRRRGHVIVVNRQLAVANAFEDLLHERWPAFGRAARQTYDRVGLPISAWIRHPLASDAVFVAMLPAQAAFELTLLAFDRDPRARIDRMYR